MLMLNRYNPLKSINILPNNGEYNKLII